MGRILGLLSILQDHPELDNIYDIANEIGKDYGETISLVKAAEILEFVDTPKDEVRFTELGKKFIAADSDTRKQIFAEQVQKLRLFHIILGYLEVQEEIDSETVMKDISTALPYENAENVLQTMIAWGRYAGLMDYDANTQMVTRPEKEIEKEEEKKEEIVGVIRSSGDRTLPFFDFPALNLTAGFFCGQRTAAPGKPPDARHVEQRLP